MSTPLSPDVRSGVMTLFQQDAPIQKILKSAESSIAAAARGSIEAPSLIRAALLQISMTPALQRCDKLSVVQAVMQAAALGLMVGGPAGEAALVPYKNRARLLPMVRGLVALAQRSKTIVAIPAYPVYKSDHFRVRYGTDLTIEHEPDLTRAGATPDDMTHVYAIVVTPSGFRDPHVMSRGEVDEIRERSASKADGPWVTDYVPMALKTVVKRATKRYDLSPEFRAATELDDRFETGRVNQPSSLLDTAEEVQAEVMGRTAERTEELKQKINGGKKIPPLSHCEACGAAESQPHGEHCPYNPAADG
ncbi:MAG: recombinase RecT [Mycobacteriales bacterium]